jgi:hypothetical protein
MASDEWIFGPISFDKLFSIGLAFDTSSTLLLELPVSTAALLKLGQTIFVVASFGEKPIRGSPAALETSR